MVITPELELQENLAGAIASDQIAKLVENKHSKHLDQKVYQNYFKVGTLQKSAQQLPAPVKGR